MKTFTELTNAFSNLAPFYAPTSKDARVWRRKVAMWLEDCADISAPADFDEELAARYEESRRVRREEGLRILAGFDCLLWNESAAVEKTEEAVELAAALDAGIFGGSKVASAIVHIAGCMVENTVEGNYANREVPSLVRPLTAEYIGGLVYDYLDAEGHEHISNRNRRFATRKKCVSLARAVLSWFFEEPGKFDAAAHPFTVVRESREREEMSVGCEFCATGRALDVDERGRPICSDCSEAVGMDSDGRHRLSNWSAGIIEAGKFEFGPGATLGIEGFEVFVRIEVPGYVLDQVFVYHTPFTFESEAIAALERLRAAFVKGSFTPATLERSSSYWSALVDPRGALAPIKVVSK